VKLAALLPAAGEGQRLGLGPKALLRLGGETLIERAVRQLSPLVDQVLVGLPPGCPPPPGAAGRPGGKTRQETVLALLEACDADLVLIHDAARPFLRSGLASAVLAAAGPGGFATAALPSPDTLVEVAGGSYRPLDRSRVQRIQTPQAGWREPLLRWHRQAASAGLEFTDDAGLAAAFGQPVSLVPGDPWLFKITTPSDWAMAQALLSAWEER
jgi:2-C-methyl-D-erythritol 4-phosphate cytidylyltransferase